MRIDVYLAQTGLATSRTRAANLIDLGRVLVNGKPVQKASLEVSEDDEIVITEDYEASLGGLKLKEAFRAFGVDCGGKICMDVGASNGGFTEVLLNKCAKLVYAIDVGECALPEKLKNDERTVVMDKTNARYLTRDMFCPMPEFCVVDVSFISLKLILPSVLSVMQTGGEVVALIKPQFECAKKDLSKKGILTDKKLCAKILEEIKSFCQISGFTVEGIVPAPHPFANKNQEYLIYLKIA